MLIRKLKQLETDKVNKLVFQALDDKTLEERFQQSNSVLRTTTKITKILQNARIKKAAVKRIVSKLWFVIVNPGVKATIRGQCFNDIVKKTMIDYIAKKKYMHLILEVEYKHPFFHEKCDFVLRNTKNKKTLVGYNQLDFWKGGAQINRSSKYVTDEQLHKNMSKRRIKVVSVIARIPDNALLTNKNSKIFKLFEIGFAKERLFFMSQLLMYIDKWQK